MEKFFCWIVILFISLGWGGCRENIKSISEKAREAFTTSNQEEAARLYNRVLTLDPDNAEAHFFLGWIYRMQGKSEEAIAAFKQAVAKNPDNGLAYQNLGDLLLTKGMLAEAIEAFNRAIAINPDSGMAYYGLGSAYKQQTALNKAADAFFEAGLLAVVSNNKELATNAYVNLKEIGNTQLDVELHAVLTPWFDPANNVPRKHQ